MNRRKVLFGEVIRDEFIEQEERGFGRIGGVVSVDESGCRDGAGAGQYSQQQG